MCFIVLFEVTVLWKNVEANEKTVSADFILCYVYLSTYQRIPFKTFNTYVRYLDVSLNLLTKIYPYSSY